MKYLAIPFILFTTSVLVQADGLPSFAATVEIQGREFKFDQGKLQESLAYIANQFNELNNSDGNTTAKQELVVLRSNMAMALLAAKYYALPTPEIITLMKNVERDWANIPLPDGFLLPEDVLKGIAGVSFVDKEGQVPDVNTLALGPGRFAMLAASARIEVESRSYPKQKSE